MRVSNFCFAAGVAAVLAGGMAVRAEDTPVQARARAALEAKMRELNARGAAPHQGATTNPIVVQMPSITARQSAEDQAKAQAALEAKLRELGAPAPAATNRTLTQTPPVATPRENSEDQAKAQAALEKKMAELNRRESAARAALKKANAPQPRPGNLPAFTPMEAPPPPVTPRQEAQLQDLLERYRDNQITPEQYQTQRAKILARP